MLLNELLTSNETISNQAFIDQRNYQLPNNNLTIDSSDSSSSTCTLQSLNQCQVNKFSLTNNSTNGGELMKEKSKNAARSRREKENAEVILHWNIFFSKDFKLKIKLFNFYLISLWSLVSYCRCQVR